MLKQFWLWITRRYHRHGYAAVSFGAPVSLSAFQREHPGAPVERLGDRLMTRIGQEVPVLPVPMVAHALLAAGTPLPEAELRKVLAGMTDSLGQAHIHIPREDLAYSVEVGLRILRKRGLVRDTAEGIEIVPEERDLLVYYANSIRQFFADAAQDG